MQDNWVDFKAVKAAVSMQAVLDRYSINWLRKSKDELRGRCPIHKGEGESTFHVNLSKNAFHCFSCKARGNVLDFVAAMEKCTVRDAALKLKDWFSVSDAAAEQKTKPADLERKSEVGESAPVNKALTFQLSGIDSRHPYLEQRGISRETAETFGAGFFAGRGSMHDRIVIPIHNEQGELVAYAGRAIDDSEPRYKLPNGFHKSPVLFNLHRVEANEVIVVEGFFDAMKLWQEQHAPVVALMGSSLSDAQEQLLLARFNKITLLLDGDAAGREAARTIAMRLINSTHVRILELPDGKQPDTLSEAELKGLLG